MAVVSIPLRQRADALTAIGLTIAACGLSLMVALGLIGAISHFLIALAYQRAPATVVVPYIYTQVGFAVVLGWLMLGDFPDPGSLGGIARVILSGIGNVWPLRLRARAG